MHKKVGAILAAGASSRFGSAKQLARFGKQTLIEIAVGAMTESDVEEICIVLGANAFEIETHLKTVHFSRCYTILKNEEWATGMASSIRTATEFAQKSDATHLLLASCDQPHVNESLFNELLRASEKNIAACKYDHTSGIPAVFPSRYFEDLLALTGDKGAKSIILHSEPVQIKCELASIDIDTPEALSHYCTTNLPS